MVERRDDVWKSPELSKQYISGVRGAIPLANEQIGVMVRVIRAARREGVTSFLDLGCGDGILGGALVQEYPDARGVFLDFSEPMLDAARARFSDNSKLTFIAQDYGVPEWTTTMQDTAPFDAIVSGLSIHHQPDTRKREIYAEIYDLLKPGGVFLNLEHVTSPSKWVESLYNEMMVDSTYSYHVGQGDTRSKQEIADEFYYRPDKAANILAPLDTQLAWLREIGYQHVDCYLKIFELAVFGGVKG
jgi:tRNA (cmo5U34)-methyltransferase